MDVEKKCPHCGKKLRRDNTRGACSACLANKEHRAGSPAPAVEKPPAAKPIQPRKQLELEGMPAAAAEPNLELVSNSFLLQAVDELIRRRDELVLGTRRLGLPDTSLAME